jgi:hypothetical protein
VHAALRGGERGDGGGVLRRFAFAGACALALAAPPAAAATQSLVGLLDPGNAQDVVLHVVTLPVADTLTIQSWGYGGSAGAPGGVNAAGAVIGAGGFDPYVSVFAGSGPTATFVASNDDGACPPGTTGDGLCGDSTLALPLAAGTYTIAISAFLNLSLAENLGSGTLGDGFAGLGSFGDRSSRYAVDVGAPSLVPPALALTQVPNGLTFGPQTVGAASGPLAVVVTNVGSGTVTLGALTVGGPDAARFAAGGSCAGTLAPGANCTVTVVFTPNAVGPFSATVTLASNATNAPTTIAVGGTGTASAVATASLSAAGVDFGARLLGSTTQQVVQVTNTGGAPLQLGYPGVDGADAGDFALGAGCDAALLAPGASCAFTVDFTPGALGARAATLTIPSNASNGPVTVGLGGVGVAPAAPSVPIPVDSPLSLALLAIAVLAAARRRLVRSRR